MLVNKGHRSSNGWNVNDIKVDVAFVLLVGFSDDRIEETFSF